MKNTLIILAIIFIFIILYFLQVNFFNWFNISGIAPNLFVILILFLGLFAGKRVGIPMGIFLGICLDFFTSKKIGIPLHIQDFKSSKKIVVVNLSYGEIDLKDSDYVLIYKGEE